LFHSQIQQRQVSLPLILDVGYNNPEVYADLVQEEIEQSQPDHSHQEHHHHHQHDDHTHHPHEYHHHHSDHLDNDGFVSIAFESDRPFDVKKFETFLQDQLPQEVFRGKGILWFKESDLRNVFQLSGPRFDLQGEEWRAPPKNQLVLIGRNLDAAQLRQHLTECIA
jgi:G3E family GTPase